MDSFWQIGYWLCGIAIRSNSLIGLFANWPLLICFAWTWIGVPLVEIELLGSEDFSAIVRIMGSEDFPTFVQIWLLGFPAIWTWLGREDFSAIVQIDLLGVQPLGIEPFVSQKPLPIDYQIIAKVWM